MDALPLELREEIFSHLLPPIDRAALALATVPIISKTERTDVYSLRLVSRRMNSGSLHAFVKIVENVPTECREDSLGKLANLVALAHVGKYITCLTLNTCRLTIPERTSRVASVEREVQERFQWFIDFLTEQLVSVLQQTPRLQHLTCVLEIFRGTENVILSGDQPLVGGQTTTELRYLKRFLLETAVQKLFDPMHYIVKALKITGLKQKLRSIVLLTGHLEEVPYEGRSPQGSVPVRFPQLEHLTVTPSCQESSTFRAHLESQHLTSLHIVLDDRGFELDPGSAEDSRYSTGFPSGLCSYTISANSAHISTETLLRCIGQATSHVDSLALLTIQDMILVMDISSVFDSLPGEGRFEDLRFDNVEYCFTDEITLSGPSDPKALDRGWKALPHLCERADRVRLKVGSDERVLSSADWK